ncbi:6-phospho-beta-glucosidase [Klebsiella pneumoniae]|uniref:6-phospho-beta-glucosidase n=1 Tax=Klebsiella pneumoniae TaxID=573 RepID=A0A377W803_KLEPN|nr:6-phospho-beta-glucosidase [Klebsiella pneumoniae]
MSDSWAARAADERLGLKYHLLGQETTGVGGFAKALRTIPVILEVARKVEQLAPEAFILNFTNPAGIVTEAVSRYSKAKIIGLCNVPINMQHMIVGMLGAQESRSETALCRAQPYGLGCIRCYRGVRMSPAR